MEKHHLNIMPDMAKEDYESLKEDIKNNGFDDKYPIYLYEGKILDGWHRYNVCNDLGIEPVYKNFEGSKFEALNLVVRSETRRHATSSQKAAVAVKTDEVFNTIKEETERERREKQSKAKEGNKNASKNNSGKNFPQLNQSEPEETPQKQETKTPQKEETKTRQKAANMFGTNPKYIDQAQRLKKENPEYLEKIANGEKTFSDFKKEEKQQKIENDKKKIEQNNLETPEGNFDVIAIDPPWAYEERGGFSNKNYDPDKNRGGVDYPTMTVNQIKNIELPLKDDAVVFLWTTHAFLRDAFDIIENWGLQYKSTIVWDKENIGMGRTIRLQCEFCLMAIKGSPIIEGKSERDIIREKRKEHSRKPDAFYNMVDRMCVGRKLDYFSRENRENWISYGAETGKF